MRRLLTITLFLSLALSAAPVKNKAASKGKATTRKASASRRPGSKNRAAVPRKPSVQIAPSSDRYKEIQEALVAKGYLKTPATGVWDQDSQEAMRKFQADEKLEATGKLTSRTLISLGLGPKQ